MQDEISLKEWLSNQTTFRLSIESETEDSRLKIARTLIKLYGDKILFEMYSDDETLSDIQRVDNMLDEILYDMKARHLRCLTDGDMFGEQSALRDGHRTASVRCTEDTHLAYITK